MNIEKADYGAVIAFGTLNDFLKKMDLENDSIESVVTILDSNGVSLLEKSIIARKFEISQYLLESGADVNVISKEGLNELHYLSANINFNGAVDIGKTLLDRGVSVMQKEKKYGNTAFFSLCIDAFKGRSEEVLAFLNDCFEYVTDVDDTNNYGYSIRGLINESGPVELKKRLEAR